ncbi:hypothetical protein [Mesohalobacter halotolerans]|uniref:Lipoprotein n=1 Tax=Mesohalobacter halotolerans TaxID=1883405 RepID=A0A4U5TSA9_9FLAO|nr:hypothetical protein [Mesohalobacter halotolerans]TKS57187.1 hypothetical protein FCN74_01860 [Mesohalobacter halotolerans]
MKKILLLILIIFLSCKKDKKKLPAEFKQTNTFQIEFLKRKISLPNNYEKTTFEDILDFIKKGEHNDSLIKSAHQKNIMLQNFGHEFEVFADENNYLNTITFMSGKYVKLDKNVLKSYVEVLKNQISNQSTEYNIQNKITEKEFLTYGKTKVIKVKFQQISADETKYLTQYLITIGINTFSIAIVNEENTDYQFILENFRV